ncbi:hypothetical protein B0H14DRAFT_2693405 [Mycena olivaceomarginata]|nr:hypothetical protein B0H14DRAFT_2693405 [Mycena olivaceomarginata]
MQYTVDAGSFNYLWFFVILNVSQTAVSLLLYGIYINLFLLFLHTLSRRRLAAGTTPLLVASCMMAAVGSTQMALDVVVTAQAARLLQQMVHSTTPSVTVLPSVELTRPIFKLLIAQVFTLVMNNLITDFIFLYRCYVIWGYKKKPIILPALLVLSTFVVVNVSYTTNKMNTHIRLLIILVAATNLVLTALTAGRILWIQRAASHVGLDSTIRARYTRAIAVILESGALYCAVAIFLLISALLNDEIFSIGWGIGQQLMNIIPTFTLLYIGRKNMRENPSADLESGSQETQKSPSSNLRSGS